MSELLIIAFDDSGAAARLDRHLQGLRAEMHLQTQDKAIVTRDADGAVDVRTPYDARVAHAIGGSIWGLVIGAAFALPVAGVLTGALAGALVGRDRDPGVGRGFLEKIAATLPKGGSALCLLVREMDEARVSAALASFPERGTLIQSPLNAQEEAALREKVETV